MNGRPAAPLPGLICLLLAASACGGGPAATGPADGVRSSGDGGSAFRYSVLSRPPETVGGTLPRTALPGEAEQASEAIRVGGDRARPAYVVRGTGGRLCLTVRRGDGGWGYTCGDPGTDGRGGVLVVAEPRGDGRWTMNALVPDDVTSATAGGEERAARGNFVSLPLPRRSVRVTFRGAANERTLDLSGLVG